MFKVYYTPDYTNVIDLIKWQPWIIYENGNYVFPVFYDFRNVVDHLKAAGELSPRGYYKIIKEKNSLHEEIYWAGNYKQLTAL
jgi:hypothetical protein